MRNIYVVSGMTDSISYCFYTEPAHPNDTPAIKEKITIRGGRGLPSNRSGFGDRHEDAGGNPLWVADGMVTPVPSDKFERLKEHHLFKKHLAAGRLRVVNQDIEGNHKAVREIVRDMPEPDSHALLTKGKIKERVKVKTPEQAEEDNFRI